jgi:hypothetical protein
MLFLYCAWDTVVRDWARMMMYTEPLKDERLRRVVGRNINATVAQGTKA